MARIRSIKPEFCTSAATTQLTIRTRLHWVMLWTHADDAGRCRDNPRLIKAALWPLDDDITPSVVEEMQAELEGAGRLVRYEVDGERFCELVGFGEHQKPRRPVPSQLPAPNPIETEPDPEPLAPIKTLADETGNCDTPPAAGPHAARQMSARRAPDVRTPRANSAPVVGGVGGVGDGDGDGENPLGQNRNRSPVLIAQSAAELWPASGDLADDFAGFWARYPRHVARRTAERAWLSATERAPTAEILAGLDRMLPDWRSRAPDKVPHAATWLNRDGWLDEPSAGVALAPSLRAVLDVAHEREVIR